MNHLTDIIAQKAQTLNITTMMKPAPVHENQIQHETTQAHQPTVSVAELKSMIIGMQHQLDSMLKIIDGNTVVAPPSIEPTNAGSTEKVVEGVFTGITMMGSDGNEYPVPANYASKSKLVEGDIMKLTVRDDGRHIYKQIHQVQRVRIVGSLTRNESGQWGVLAGAQHYNVLTASVTFYRGSMGDVVTLLLPNDGGATWGTVEHISKS